MTKGKGQVMQKSQTMSRGGNPYLPHSQRRAEEIISQPKRHAPPAKVKGGVPIGTSVQIQAWVGDDPDRAQLALTREKATEKPRITLVSHLQSVLKKHGVLPPPAPVADEGPALVTPTLLDLPQETVVEQESVIDDEGPVEVVEVDKES
jgi:hypothetical protein